LVDARLNYTGWLGLKEIEAEGHRRNTINTASAATTIA
jgi:hypothetical protein